MSRVDLHTTLITIAVIVGLCFGISSCTNGYVAATRLRAEAQVSIARGHTEHDAARRQLLERFNRRTGLGE